MTMKSWAGLVAVAMLAMTLGCSRTTPLSPSQSSDGVAGTASLELAASETTTPVVTFLPDLTANPSLVTVAAGSTVKMVNSSGRYAKVHSYNCPEFSMVNLPDGGWRNTQVFRPAGKTCDYFVWDVNWSRKLFEGQVVVQ